MIRTMACPEGAHRRDDRPVPKLIGARPFRPFTLRTADGREIEVSHPESIAYGGGRIAVAVARDDVEIIDLLLVPSLKTTAGEAP